MDDFEGLGLQPGLVEALASEGVEVPLPLQREVIPVVRKGHSALVEGGAGSGASLAATLGVLSRLGTGPGAAPSALVLSPSEVEVRGLAPSLARLGSALDRRVAVLGGGWAAPAKADLLVSTPEVLAGAVARARIKLDSVQAVLVHDLGVMRSEARLGSLEEILTGVPREAQRVLTALPAGEFERSFLEAHAHRPIVLPSHAGEVPQGPLRPRGRIQFRVSPEPADELGEAIQESLERGAEHVLLYFRSEDRAADIGDLMGLHGYAVGAPGDGDATVWLGVHALEVREALPEDLAPDRINVVSVDVPPDADSLDRRHAPGAGGMTLLHSRELPHLRKIAAEAGYELEPAPFSWPSEREEEAHRYRERLRRAIEDEDVTAQLTLLEPLFRDHSPAEVAGALSLLLRREGREAGLSRPDPDVEESQASNVPRPTAWVKVFLSIGERDGIGPGDLLGAITGEAEIRGEQVGKIEIRDTFSKVDVEDRVARKVIEALNGSTLRGRSIRADFDRGDRARASDRRRPGKGGRKGG